MTDRWTTPRLGASSADSWDAGNDAVVVTGTTGESPVLSDDERFNLYREALAAVGDRALVIAGTGGYDTAESVRLSREAAEIGVHGLLQVTPYYNKPPQDGLVLHFETIAAATPLPNMLYNVPARTSLNMTADTVARLSAVDNIVAVKEASGDFDQIGGDRPVRPKTGSISTAATTATPTWSWPWAARAWSASSRTSSAARPAT